MFPLPVLSRLIRLTKLQDGFLQCPHAGVTHLVPWHFEIDPDPEQITLLTAGVLAFDNDAARYDPVKEAVQLLGALTYSRCDGIRRVHMAKTNLKRQLHRILHSLSTNVGDGERSAFILRES